MDLEGSCHGRIYYQVCAASDLQIIKARKKWWGFVVRVAGTPRYVSSNNAVSFYWNQVIQVNFN
jgi:hypothetical protein